MILKKPYGLLIKHFKLIHILLTIAAAFLISRTGTVIDFFRDYVANDYSVTIIDNMASYYVNWVIYLLIFVILIVLIALYVLLKYKKKPSKFYMAAIGYYVFLLLMMFVAAALIGSLNNGLWETASARQYRDFANIIYYPQYIFVLLFATRALGFNVKQFDFKNDLKDLELSEEDSALIEINIGFDTTKVERGVRRTIREFTYYFKENKFIFYIGIGLVSVFLLYSLISGYEKVKYTYRQGKTFNYNQFKINVEDSILTNVNYNGQVLDDDLYYLLIKFNITNYASEDRAFDYRSLKIYFGSDYYTPSIDLGNYFLDYAKPYGGEKLVADNEGTYLLAYALPKKYVNRSFAISIHTGFSLKKKNYTAKSIVVKLNPVKLEEVQVVKNASLNETVSFGGTYLENSSLSVKDYHLGQKYSYKYEDCYYEKCKTYDDFVVADTNLKNKQTLLILGYDFVLDESTAYYRNYKLLNDFVGHFVSIRYKVNDEEKIVKSIVKTPTNLKDKIVIQVPGEVDSAQSIDLVITIRNKTYIIKLKTE